MFLQKNVHYDSSDGQNGSLPLPPPLLLLAQFARRLGEEHHVLFALDLPLEELQRRAVKAHPVLRQKRDDEAMKETETTETFFCGRILLL